MIHLFDNISLVVNTHLVILKSQVVPQQTYNSFSTRCHIFSCLKRPRWPTYPRVFRQHTGSPGPVLPNRYYVWAKMINFCVKSNRKAVIRLALVFLLPKNFMSWFHVEYDSKDNKSVLFRPWLIFSSFYCITINETNLSDVSAAAHLIHKLTYAWHVTPHAHVLGIWLGLFCMFSVTNRYN